MRQDMTEKSVELERRIVGKEDEISSIKAKI